jgi:hypothetical protein
MFSLLASYTEIPAAQFSLKIRENCAAGIEQIAR